MVVVGGGRYGQIALKRLKKRVSLVVEPDPGPELESAGAAIWRTDGLEAARQMLSSGSPPSHIIPTLPKHLLAGWLRLELANMQPEELDMPDGLLAGLDAFQHPAPGTVYLSLADFICPDDCPEPADYCSKTGEPRGQALYDRLRGLESCGISHGVLRSHQLAPGVGGLKSAEMLELRNSIRAKAGKWLIATACKCHGVAQLLRFH